MVSNQKVEENRPPLEFNFTYWEEFSALHMACIAPAYDLYTTCINYTVLDNCTELNIKQVHNIIIHFHNLKTDLKVPPSM